MHQDHPPSDESAENDFFHPQFRPVRFQYLTADDEMKKLTSLKLSI